MLATAKIDELFVFKHLFIYLFYHLKLQSGNYHFYNVSEYMKYKNVNLNSSI